MIEVTRLNGSKFILNCELIETLEHTPDTIISTTNAKKYVVTESIDEVIKLIIKFKNQIFLINRV